MKIIERFRNDEIMIECFNRDEKIELASILKKNNLDGYTIRYVDCLSFLSSCVFYGSTHNNYSDYNKTYLIFQEFKQLLKEEENLFTKDDLRSGDLVVTRDEGNAIVFKGIEDNEDGISFFDGGALKFNEYYTNYLKFSNGDGFNRKEIHMRQYDILKVYRPVALHCCMSEELNNSDKYKLIYERQEKSQEELEFEIKLENMRKNYKKDLETIERLYDDAINETKEAINKLKKQ